MLIFAIFGHVEQLFVVAEAPDQHEGGLSGGAWPLFLTRSC